MQTKTHSARNLRTRRAGRFGIRGRRGLLGGLVLVVLGILFAVAPLVHRGQGDLVRALREAPATRISSRVLTSENGHELREILLADDVGPVSASLRVPHDPTEMAALIIVGGLRTGRDAVELVDASLPCVVAALDYACEIPRTLEPWDVVRVPSLQRDLLRTAVALRDLVAHVRADARVDPDRVFVVGASLGTPFASAVAALLSPAGLILMHGFADHETLVEHRLASSVASPTARRAIARLTALLTGAFDAQRTLPRLRDVPVLVVEADDDDMVPLDCRLALWNATPEPRVRVQVPGGHLKGGRRTDVLDAAMLRTRDWLVERGVPELAL